MSQRMGGCCFAESLSESTAASDGRMHEQGMAWQERRRLRQNEGQKTTRERERESERAREW